jgi:hypothetical protein
MGAAGERAASDADVLDPSIALGDADGHARGIEEVLGRLRNSLQCLAGVALRVGDGVQDFGTGLLTVGDGPQLVLETEIDQRAGGLALDRRIPLIGSRLQLPLELGNPLLEIGHGVLWKRGHSLKNP